MKKVLLLSLCFILFMSLMNISATAESKEEISIAITPAEVMYSISNMKPGDWAPRTISVINTGKQPFAYQMSLRNDGSEKLFNEFLLEIKSTEEVLYSGKITDFTNLPARQLDVAAEEKLEITVLFPEHLGNDFQGLDSEFTFIFTAEGKEFAGRDKEEIGNTIGTDDQHGSSLPTTATNIFNILLIGGIFLTVGVIFSVVHAIRKFRRRQIGIR